MMNRLVNSKQIFLRSALKDVWPKIAVWNLKDFSSHDPVVIEKMTKLSLIYHKFQPFSFTHGDAQQFRGCNTADFYGHVFL